MNISPFQGDCSVNKCHWAQQSCWCLGTLTLLLASWRFKIRASTFSCKSSQNSLQGNASRGMSGYLAITWPSSMLWNMFRRMDSSIWNTEINCCIWAMLNSREMHHMCSSSAACSWRQALTVYCHSFTKFLSYFLIIIYYCIILRQHKKRDFTKFI